MFSCVLKCLMVFNTKLMHYYFFHIGSAVITKGCDQPMHDCDHEEADTRICIHVQDALLKGAHKVMVRTVDTDVVVILVGIFFSVISSNPSAEIWVAFGKGKHFTYYNINAISSTLGEQQSRSLPCFHAFTGSDTTSQFHGKGKKTAWQAWKCYPEVTEAFHALMDTPFMHVETVSMKYKQLERFVCVLYDRTTPLDDVNELRQELFQKTNKMMENIPPTRVRVCSLRPEFVVISFLLFHLMIKTYIFLYCSQRCCNTLSGQSTRPVFGPQASKPNRMSHPQKSTAGTKKVERGSLSGQVYQRQLKLAENC